MSTGSILPPDIREKMGQQPPRGIGGGASENATAAKKRSVAMNPDEQSAKEEAVSPTTPEPSEDEYRTRCPNVGCGSEITNKKWNYCPTCSTDLMLGGFENRLGIDLGEDDLSDYLFKGYITRDVKVLGKHVATMKSAQPRDLQEIDSYIMNGDWAKDEDGKDRKISEFFMRQMNALCNTASCVMKIDGESIGDSLESRMEWLMERGSAFVDILSQKVSWYNQALTEFLKKEDTVLGS
jgi:hypothetical protein